MSVTISTIHKYQKVAGGSSTLLNDIVAYWNGEEASGNAIDQVGSLDGVCTGIAYQQASSGIVNYGYTFNGSTDVITIGDHSELELQQLSISLWVKVTYGVYGLFTNCVSGEGYQLMVDGGSPGNVSWWLRGDPYPRVLGSIDITDGEWHHIVATYDKINLKVYVDGELDGTTPATQTITYVGTSCLIGDDPIGDTTNLDGYIDEIGIWSRALTESEIDELYNGGSGKTYPFS